MKNIVLILLCSFFISGCMTNPLGSIYDEYQPIVSNQFLDNIDTLDVYESDNLIFLFDKPDLNAENSYMATNSSSGESLAAAAIGSLILGVVDGVSQGKAKKKLQVLNAGYKNLDACIENWHSADGNGLKVPLDLANIVNWGIDKGDGFKSEPSKLYESVADHMQKSDGIEAILTTRKIVNFSYDFSTIDIQLVVSLFVDQEPDQAKKKMAESAAQALKGENLKKYAIARNVERYSIHFQDKVKDDWSSDGTDNFLCPLEDEFYSALSENQQRNIAFWFGADGEKLQSAINASAVFHKKLVGLRSEERYSPQWVAPEYENVSFRTFNSLPNSSKKVRSVSLLRAFTLLEGSQYKVIQKYNGDYFIYPKAYMPYSQFGF